MHLPVKSKTIDEATEHDADASNTGEQEPAKEKFYCDICGKYYDKTFEQVHVQMHNGNEKYNCGICNKVFPNEESINMHKNAHQDTRVVSSSWIDYCDKIKNSIFLVSMSISFFFTNRLKPKLN